MSIEVLISTCRWIRMVETAWKANSCWFWVVIPEKKKHVYFSTYVYLVSLNQHMDFSFQPQQKSHNSSENEIPVNSGKHMGLFMAFYGFSMNNSRMFQCFRAKKRSHRAQVSQAQDAMLHKPRPRWCHGMAGYHGMELTNYGIYMRFIWDYGI